MTAYDGQAGLDALAQASPKPNIILLDVMLPKVNGFEVLGKVKADPASKGIPVILLTNLGGGEEDRKKGMEMGAVDYLVKSDLTPAQIVEKVKALIG